MSVAATVLRVQSERLILVRIGEDNVPCVDEAWEVAEAEEGDVDEGVGRADAAFDPYWWMSQELVKAP